MGEEQPQGRRRKQHFRYFIAKAREAEGESVGNLEVLHITEDREAHERTARRILEEDPTAELRTGRLNMSIVRARKVEKTVIVGL